MTEVTAGGRSEYTEDASYYDEDEEGEGGEGGAGYLEEEQVGAGDGRGKGAAVWTRRQKRGGDVHGARHIGGLVWSRTGPQGMVPRKESRSGNGCVRGHVHMGPVCSAWPTSTDHLCLVLVPVCLQDLSGFDPETGQPLPGRRGGGRSGGGADEGYGEEGQGEGEEWEGGEGHRRSRRHGRSNGTGSGPSEGRAMRRGRRQRTTQPLHDPDMAEVGKGEGQGQAGRCLEPLGAAFRRNRQSLPLRIWCGEGGARPRDTHVFI